NQPTANPDWLATKVVEVWSLNRQLSELNDALGEVRTNNEAGGIIPRAVHRRALAVATAHHRALIQPRPNLARLPADPTSDVHSQLDGYHREVHILTQLARVTRRVRPGSSPWWDGVVGMAIGFGVTQAIS